MLAALAALIVAAAPAGALAPVEATVTRVVDGDTLWAEIAEPGHRLASREKVRLVGIDCPERDQTPRGPQATARLSALVLGTSVQLEVALQSRDQYGRLLGSIWRDCQLIQEQLVPRGAVRAVPGAAQHRVRRADPGGGRAGPARWGWDLRSGRAAPRIAPRAPPAPVRQPISRESAAPPELPHPA